MKNENLNKLFNSNSSLSKLNKMEKQDSYLHEAEKKHTDLYLQDKYSFLKFTPENLSTFQLGFLEGVKLGMEQSLGEMLTPTIVRNEEAN